METIYRSRYNYFVDRPDGVMAYNARTGTFALLSRQIAEQLRSAAELPDFPDLVQLLEMGFLHAGDEKDRLISFYRDGKQADSGKLSLTIAPTLACNRKCGYCYQTEYRTGKIMSPQTQAATISFVRSRVQAGQTEVHCVWYGGEPLLAKTILFDMCSRLKAGIEEEGGRLLPMMVVTNGVLLDAETARRLAESGVKSAQISFDSMIDDGYEHRGLVTQDRKPSIILTNILSAMDHLKLHIRVNVTRSNQSTLPEMLSILRDRGLGKLTYLARVSNLEAETGAVTDRSGKRHRREDCNDALFPLFQPSDDTLTRFDFSELESSLMLNRTEALNTISRKLTPRSRFCCATSESQFVIAPDGEISRCWDSAGSNSESIGSVHDRQSKIEESEVYRRWLAESPFSCVACTACKVLPLCMGGCPHTRLFMQPEKPLCEAIEQQIQFCVELVGKRLSVPPVQNGCEET
jgi:uncharacterized protein